MIKEQNDLLIYKNKDGNIVVDAIYKDETLWLSQNLIAELFGVGRSTVTEHINNILNSGELDEKNTVGKTDIDNSRKPVKIYNLDMIVTMYLDYAQMQAENHNAMTMKDWVEKLNAFLKFNGKEILHNAGKISAQVAQELAYKEYDKFKLKQDKIYQSDFDKFLNEAKKIKYIR